MMKEEGSVKVSDKKGLIPRPERAGTFLKLTGKPVVAFKNFLNLISPGKNQPYEAEPKTFSSHFKNYVFAALAVGIAALFCSPLSNTPGYHIVSFILLFVVSFLATFIGIGPVFFASTLSALLWNYFFIPPHFTFHIDKLEDILMFGMFFIIALLNGILTTRVRKQEQLAREREKRTNTLFQLTKELSKASGFSEVLKITTEQIKNNFSTDIIILLQDGNGKLDLSGKFLKGKRFNAAESEVAIWAFGNDKVAGKYTKTRSSEEYTWYPMAGTMLNPGIIGLKHNNPFPPELNTFWNTFLVQISNALEREFLGELAQKARFLDESDRLYKTLFNSISHELRIPVATIMGASDTLLSLPHSGNMQDALHNEIFTASRRLNRLIENLLNISRLESGRISVNLNWCDMNDLINKVTEDLSDDLKPFSLIADIPEEMPLVSIDFGLMEQVLYNLLYNSCEHAPVASNIRVKVSYLDAHLVIQVLDRGPGFPPDKLSMVFDKFFRIGGKTGGLGLGLSIVKGFVDAHKGTVTAENRKNGGAKFTITIPTNTPDISNFIFEKNV
jgi:K+-sensing histidine kinase KdpD